jgi:hypothetical protein
MPQGARHSQNMGLDSAGATIWSVENGVQESECKGPEIR